jgi:hypothetical protein
MPFATNEIFKSYNKAQRKTYTYKYLGVDENYYDTCSNIKLEDMETNEIIHVEKEWFNQRVITRIV